MSHFCLNPGSPSHTVPWWSLPATGWTHCWPRTQEAESCLARHVCPGCAICPLPHGADITVYHYLVPSVRARCSCPISPAPHPPSHGCLVYDFSGVVSPFPSSFSLIFLGSSLILLYFFHTLHIHTLENMKPFQEGLASFVSTSAVTANMERLPQPGEQVA